ncbi:MAG: hypothetical protein WDL87_07695 [Candidatus Omnitrophota bacterium]|jgi:hypothetical protein
MAKIAKLTVMVAMFVLVCIYCSVSAETITNELQEGRYVLIMMNGRAIVNNRVPGMILDSYKGIVWTCQNLQDGKPLWVKTDLGQNGDKQMTRKRYIAKMLEWQDADLRMPAVVLDTDDGMVWNCPNIVDGKATWIQKDLNVNFQEEVKKDDKKN